MRPISINFIILFLCVNSLSSEVLNNKDTIKTVKLIFIDYFKKETKFLNLYKMEIADGKFRFEVLDSSEVPNKRAYQKFYINDSFIEISYCYNKNAFSKRLSYSAIGKKYNTDIVDVFDDFDTPVRIGALCARKEDTMINNILCIHLVLNHWDASGYHEQHIFIEQRTLLPFYISNSFFRRKDIKSTEVIYLID